MRGIRLPVCPARCVILFAASAAPAACTLAKAVRHYSELDEDRLHQTGEKLLRALTLSKREIADLVAFLETPSPARR